MKYLLPPEERSTFVFVRPLLLKIYLDPDFCLMLEPKILGVLNVTERPFHLVASTQLDTYLVDISKCYLFPQNNI